MQQIDFHADNSSHVKKVRREVATLDASNYVHPRSCDDWTSICLAIPPVCSSTMNEFAPSSQIIRVSYAVVLKLEAVSLFHFDKEIIVPVVIGTMPLVEHGHHGYSGFHDDTTTRGAAAAPIVDFSSSSSMVNSPPPYSYRVSFFEPETEDLPPEYDEIVGDVVQSDARTFKPYYPYFGGLSSS